METVLVISSIALWVVVLVNLLLTFALVRRINTNAQSDLKTGLEAGQLAPDFTASTLSGETVTRSTYDGRNIGFVFISTHCGPCHEILPGIEALKHKASQSGIELTLVSVDDLIETQAYVEQRDIHLPILVAPRDTNSFMQDYRAAGTPSYCFVDEQGKVYSAGFLSMHQGEWKALDTWARNTLPVASKRR